MNSEGEERSPNYDFVANYAEGKEGEEAAKHFVHGSKHESKLDFMASKTGNLYVETEQFSDLFQTDRRPSGLSTTEADFWHWPSPTLKGGLWVETNTLRELIAKNSFREGSQLVTSNSTNGSIGTLLPLDALFRELLFIR